MVERPTGTVTFLFTDIEGSTRLWERDAKAMRTALNSHDEILNSSIEALDGFVFKTIGDACCAAFGSASNAIEAGLEVQRVLSGEEWEEGFELRVRMALHTSIVEEQQGDYFDTLGRLAAARGEARRAARIWGGVWGYREGSGIPWLSEDREMIEPYMEAARTRLDEATWQEEWEKGRSMTLDQAVGYALEGIGERAES